MSRSMLAQAPTAAPLFIDISTFQPENIDWSQYVKWSASASGVAWLSIRSSYGNGFEDDKYKAHLTNARAAAKALGIPLNVVHYHYAYPQDDAAGDEANWQFSVVGDLSAFPDDVLMLDYEENVSQATASWAKAWCKQQLANYGGRRPTIYASKSYAESRLQDPTLPAYADYTEADWTFDPSQRPPCAPPWTSYKWLQWTDQDSNVPGVPEAVDADIFLGGNVGADSPLVQWVGNSPNFWSGNTKTYVVIHGTATCGPQTGYELATSSEFNDGKSASVHYINDVDGSRYQIVHEHDAAWGNCCVTGNACAPGTLPVPGTGDCHDPWLDPSHNYNFDTISIENVKHSCDNSEQLTDIQYKTLVELVVDICNRNNIPKKHATGPDGGIIGHYDLDPVNRARCPGGFHWSQFIADVQAGGAGMGVPQGWSDDGTTLTAPNKITVVHGFRDEILNAPFWDGANVPQEEEQHVGQVLYHRPDLGAGQQQLFRDDMLWWTSAKGVIREKELGLEIFLRDQKIAALEAAGSGGGTPPPPPDTSAVKADLDSALSSLSSATASIQQAETDLSKI